MADDERNREAAERIRRNLPRYRSEDSAGDDEFVSRLPHGERGDTGDSVEERMFQEIMRGALGSGLSRGRQGAKPSTLIWRPSRGAGSAARAPRHPGTAAAKGDAGAGSKAVASAPGTSGSSTLVASMAARLRSLEASHARMRSDLTSKEQEVSDLRHENQELRRTLAEAEAAAEEDEGAGGGGAAQADEVISLRGEVGRLRRQIAEMEAFLNDYGLVWVGGEHDEENKYAGFDLKVDFDVLRARVEALNARAGQGGKRVVTRGGARQFADVEHVPFRVYEDGFMLFRGPFRPISESANQMFIRDILDGYFPSEFKGKFPDGVALDIVDCTGTTYAGREAAPPTHTPDADGAVRGAGGKVFHGEGQRLGGGPAGAPGRPVTLADMGDPDLPLSQDAFLRQFPEHAVRQGRVVKVREGLGDFIGAAAAGSRRDVVVVETPALAALSGAPGGDSAEDGAHAAEGGGGEDALAQTFRATHVTAPGLEDQPVATLQIRSDTGRQTLILKLHYTDTIGDVRRYIDEHRTRTTAYDLRSMFPNKVHTDTAQTLEAAGLVPNAVLLLRVRR